MKNKTGKLLLLAVFLIVFCREPAGQAQAQSDTATAAAASSLPDPDGLVPVTTAPANGIYWGLSGELPPSPFDPAPQLNLYWGGVSNNYIYDDREFDWTNYWEQTSSRVAKDRFAKDAPPAPPGGTGGTGGGATPDGSSSSGFHPPGSGYTNCVTWQEFWCSQIAVGSGGLYVTLSNTLPGVTYQLQETTNLATPSWVDVDEVTASNFTVEFGPISETAQNLFFRGLVNTNGQYPAITQSPLNQVAAVAGSATFTVTASGVAPLSYQWQFDGGNIPGATNSSYTISNIGVGNYGSYSVVVSNIVCEADSAVAVLSPAWSIPLGAGFTASPAIGSDGFIYIANLNNQLFALNPSTGATRWAITLATPNSISDLTSSAAVAANNSAVYIGSQDGFLYAFNPTNGNVLGSDQVGGSMGSVISSPAVSPASGSVLVATANSGSSGLFNINPLSQMTNWLFAADDYLTGIGPIDSSPAIGADCSSYFLSSTGDLYAVDSGGNLKWFFPIPAGSSPDASPAIDSEGNIVVGSMDGVVYSVNAMGSLNWIFDTLSNSSPIQASAAIGPDGTVYVASSSGVLFALINGVLAWEFNATNANGHSLSLVSSPAVGADNVVYFGARDAIDNIGNGVYAVTNGELKSFFNTGMGGAVLSSPALSPDGGVVVADLNGNVYKLPGSAPAAPTGWPMFRQNPLHSGAVPNPSCAPPVVVAAFPNNPTLNSPQTQFSFHLTGTSNTLWTVYQSSDLENWTPIGGVTLSALGDALFTDFLVAGVSNRFYEAQSSGVCSTPIGFINVTVPYDVTLVANQLNQINDGDTPQNTAQGLLDFMKKNSLPLFPDETEIERWNGTGYDADTFNPSGGGWVPNGDIPLLPGDSVLFLNPSNGPVTIPFAGLVSQGVVGVAIYSNQANFLSSIVPKTGRIHTDLGLNPNYGDTVDLEIGGSGPSYTYLGDNNWIGGEPVIGLGQGFFVHTQTNYVWMQTNSPCSGTFQMFQGWSNNLSLNGIDASPAIGPNGIVLLPTRDNVIWALNPHRGRVLWSNADFVNLDFLNASSSLPEQEITSSPMVSADASTVYFGTASGFVAAQTNLTVQGITEWSNFVNAGVFSSPAQAGNGNILVGSDDTFNLTGIGATGIYEYLPNGMDVAGFSEIATNLQDVDGSPAIGADSTVYFISERGGLPLEFMALSTNGTVTWAFPISTDNDNPVDASPAIDSNGVVYATGFGQYLYAINPDGSPKWIFDIGSADSFAVGSPTIGPGGMIVVGSTHRLYAVTNGSLKWAFPPVNSGATITFQSSPAIDTNGSVYVGGMDGNFYEISNNGVLIAGIPAPAPIVSSPVISSNSVTNLVIYASTDGSVFAQEIPAGLGTNADWPMFRRNPSHSARQDSGPTLAHASGAPFPFINGSGDGFDGSGDFQFSVVGPSGTNWEVFTSSDFQTWSDTGIAAALNTGPGPQLGTFTTNVGANTTGFFFMDSNGGCSKAIGFIETTLPAGTNLFSVPLYQINPNYTVSSAPNTLATLMPAGNYPGVEVDIWNGIELNAYTNDGNNWFLDGTNNSDGLLLPGQAARMITTNSITITNVGLVRDGAEVAGTDYVTNYITGPTNYLSSILPITGGISSVLNFPASPEDQITRWVSGVRQKIYTYTNGGSGTNWVWSPFEPQFGPGQGFILTTTNVNNVWVQSYAPCYGQ